MSFSTGLSPSIRYMFSSLIIGPLPEVHEKLRDKEVRHEYRDRGEHHALGGAPADADRAAVRVQALVAPDHRDDEPEEHRLHEAQHHVRHIEAVKRGRPIKVRVDVYLGDGYEE